MYCPLMVDIADMFVNDETFDLAVENKLKSA